MSPSYEVAPESVEVLKMSSSVWREVPVTEKEEEETQTADTKPRPPRDVSSCHVSSEDASQEKPVWRHSLSHPGSSLLILSSSGSALFKHPPCAAVRLTEPATSPQQIMDFSQSFSVLNESLKPRVSSEQLYSSLNRLEDRQPGSLRSRTYQRTVLTGEPKVSGIITGQRDPAAPQVVAEQEDLVSGGPGEGNCLIAELNLKDVGDEELADEDSSSTQSEEKDSQVELTTKGTRDSSGSESGNSFQMNFVDGTLPDLLNSGKPLSRRRTLGHVSATLNEVRREVELSRKRSIRLKAQVDKLQENRAAKGGIQDGERVREQLVSALRLLQPLTDPESSPPQPREMSLDTALTQLQNVARQLAFNHTKQEFKCVGGRGDSAILQQALWDRDEAMEKKKAMEAELLRSKTEMMSLNNQLLEAVQRRLELSLELEAWKEDVQLMLQQQVQNQQQAELAQRKQSRTLGILRRNRTPVQRLNIFPTPSPVPPTTNTSQIFIPRAAAPSTPTPSTGSAPSPTVTQRNWRDKLRRGKNNRDSVGQESAQGKDDGFQAVSLD